MPPKEPQNKVGKVKKDWGYSCLSPCNSKQMLHVFLAGSRPQASVEYVVHQGTPAIVPQPPPPKLPENSLHNGVVYAVDNLFLKIRGNPDSSHHLHFDRIRMDYDCQPWWPGPKQQPAVRLLDRPRQRNTKDRSKKAEPVSFASQSCTIHSSRAQSLYLM